ncbi:MAG: tRNA (adenosine(37)-N6)-threonylcarbamoyltransferase complex dimerization subunit type 1 TsaB [Gammaproteobacteria bacterium]|nr:tRNA (adenosine(37)-N6)-threonylcarbamoyltransferase complex dimerization subunit type 1 TsaB [Gammaproteobacteria bacterium]MDH4312726.1 tRNA (adenosine(37)-N6)-threonylcarbamoyltransferase complex dimerization subunit type 1 TsaB [Gammaproteobacteria bacterium]
MTRLRVLAIDTSTEACSAALLWSDGELRQRFVVTERGHAELILPMIDELLAEAGCRLRDLDGLAFGRGPGGFTGLRIAAGVIQGLAYGAGLRVAPVSSLAAVAFLTSSVSGPSSPSPGEGILVCNDARMNEVYWGCYRFDPGDPCVPIALSAEAVGPEDRVQPTPTVMHFAGNGLARYPALQARLESAGLRYHEGVYPRADAIARLGERMLQQGEGVDAAEALPVYIRDDVARPARLAVTGLS